MNFFLKKKLSLAFSLHLLTLILINGVIGMNESNLNYSKFFKCNQPFFGYNCEYCVCFSDNQSCSLDGNAFCHTKLNLTMQPDYEASSKHLPWPIISGILFVTLDFLCIACIPFCIRYCQVSKPGRRVDITKFLTNIDNFDKYLENKFDPAQTEPNRNNTRTTLICNSCRKEITDDLLAKFNCGHSFHTNCIKINCPLRHAHTQNKQAIVDIGN
jgi:hypothetical protein